MRRATLAITAFALGASGMPLSALAEDDEQPADELIHSDLPLITDEWDRMWPQHFTDGDSFGCASRVAFGDWVLHVEGDNGDDDESWFRFQNYGVFHCYAMVGESYDREHLATTDLKSSHFIRIGETDTPRGRVELWVVQIGGRPGSDYLLLARQPAEGLITSFEMLQRECPRDNRRDAGNIDILLTRYCAINTETELVRLSRRMADLPPLGRLTRVEDSPDESAASQSEE